MKKTSRFLSLGMLTFLGSVMVSVHGMALAQDDADQQTESEQRFNGIDKNGDGYISRSEAEGVAELTESFDEVDIDKNDQLDEAEFAQFEMGIEEGSPTK